MNLKTRFLLAFSIVWFVCYIFFPAWSLPVSNTIKLTTALIFILYLSINLILLSNWLKPESLKWGQTPFSLKDTLKENKILVSALIINFTTHIYPMTLPIPTIGDQHYHSYAPLGILSKLNPICEKYFHLPFSQGIAWLLLFFFIVALIIQIKLKIVWHDKLKQLFIMLTILSCLYVIFLIRSNILGCLGELGRHLHRYPPLGKLTYLVWYSIVGVSEFKARLISLIFIYASAVYLYRLVRLFIGKFPAIASAVLFIFFPFVFHYSHDIYLESGATFFVVSASFYFLKYYLHKNFTDLVLSSFLIGTGFLYKETSLPIWGICVIFGIIFRKLHLRDTVMMGWFSIAPVIPWIIIQHSFPQRPYFFTPHNFISPDAILAQFAVLHISLTPVICIIALIGFISSLMQKDCLIIWYSIIWFAVYYLFVTGDEYYSLIRFMLPAYPVLAIVSAIGIDKLGKLHWRLPKVILYLLIAYLGITNCVLRFRPFQWRFLNIQSYDPTVDSVYLPYDKLIEYVKQNIPQGSKVLAPMICEPSHFYLELNNVFDKYTWYRKAWLPKEYQTMDNLCQFCGREGFGYFVVNDAPLPDWTKLINDEIVATLKKQSDTRFTLVNSWTMAGNTLFLYKVN